MIHCKLAQQCVFLAGRDEGEEMRAYLTGLYCAGNFSDCARYRAALDMGQELVPDDIFPNEDDFVSLFTWAVNLRETQDRKAGRPRSPGRLPVPGAEKNAASSGHLPALRQTRSRH